MYITEEIAGCWLDSTINMGSISSQNHKTNILNSKNNDNDNKVGNMRIISPNTEI